MTRENKLALVLGFGLLLVVAILISDHFSTVRDQQSAELLPVNDPLAESRRSDPTLISFNAPAPPRSEAPRNDRTMAASPDTIESPRAGSAGGVDPGAVRMPDLQSPEHHVLGGQQFPEQAAYVFHQVRPDETLTAVCKAYYGDDSLVGPLARYNNIVNPNNVRAGHRLRIPDVSVLRPNSSQRSTPLLTNNRTEANNAPATRTYTIRKHDKLWNLAKTMLKSGARWRELYELNRDVISDPDNLKPGTIIRIPEG